MYTPNGLFSGDYISALRGCCALKFLHTLEIDQGLQAHPRRGRGSSPPKKSWKLKISLKDQRARVHNFRNSGSIFTKLFHATCHYCERNFVFLKLILHSDLQRRAASRLALPCPSSFQYIAKKFYCIFVHVSLKSAKTCRNSSKILPYTTEFQAFPHFLLGVYMTTPL